MWQDGRVREMRDSLRALVDSANRAGVVIYTIDARGLVATGATAEDTSPESSDGRQGDLMKVTSQAVDGASS